MEKQKTLYQQARLHDRGAAEMVLQTISASKGTHTTTHCRPSISDFEMVSLTFVCFRSTGPNGNLHSQAWHLHSKWRKHFSSTGTTPPLHDMRARKQSFNTSSYISNNTTVLLVIH